MAITNIGFIGLGNMGRPMATNLVKQGYNLTVYDVSEAAVDDLVKMGAKSAVSSAKLAVGKDLVITMLPSSPHVRQVVLGRDGLLGHMAPPAIYMDMSTIDPVTTREVAAVMKEQGIPMLDAPVTKGVKAAESGQLSIYIGGENDILEKVRPVLDVLGSNIYHMGEVGAGQTTKLANAVCLATNVAVAAEAVVFGVKSGVNPDMLARAIYQGSGSSRAMKTHIHDYAMRRTFDKPAFPVQLMMKDLELVMDTARSMELPVFYTALSHEILTMLKAKGRGKGFFAEVMTIYEDYAGITIEGGEDEL